MSCYKGKYAGNSFYFSPIHHFNMLLFVNFILDFKIVRSYNMMFLQNREFNCVVELYFIFGSFNPSIDCDYYYYILEDAWLISVSD